MESSRECIKSVLQCLDEGAYDRGITELKSISAVPSTIELRLFLEGLVLLVANERHRAAEQFDALLLHLDQRKERSSYVEQYAVLLTLALYSMSAGTSTQVHKALERFLRSAERQMVEQLVSNPTTAYDPENYELQITLQIVFGVWRATSQDSVSPTELLKMNLIRQVELVHGGQSAVETFEDLSGQEEGVNVLVRLGNCTVVRKLSYEYLLDAYGALSSRSDNDNRQEAIDHLGQIVHHVEPRVGNTHENVMLYKILKPKLNELALRHFIQLGKIKDGFEWLESELEGKGMDFLRTETEHHKAKEGLDESKGVRSLDDVLRFAYDNNRLVVPQEHFPCKRSIDEMATFRSGFLGESMSYQVTKVKRVISYNVSLDTYLRLLNDPIQMAQLVREEIIQKISDNTNSIRSWAIEDEDVQQIRFPFQVGELFRERRKFDDAILLFRQSHADVEQILKAIEQCQRERDTVVSEDIKENLPGLATAERKQLFPYSIIFKSEILLRNAVDRQMKEARNNVKWLEGDRNPNLRDAKRSCIERQSKYEKDVSTKDRVSQKRLIDFSTLPELVTIINENWDVLKHHFLDRQQLMTLLVPLSQIRLDVAQSRLIDDTQFETVMNLCRELNKVLKRP
jgi:hypothetical protein